MQATTYRDSHTNPGYGKEYETAYALDTYYGDLWSTIERPLLKSTLSNLKTESSTCLDFACGTGRILNVVESVFGTATGVDVSKAMISVAKEKCQKSQIICQDITSQHLEREFDVVTAFRFFRNAESQLRDEALDAINSHLKAGGRLVANIHGNPYAPGMMALKLNSLFRGTFASTISRTEFSKLLKRHGFTVESYENYSYLPRIGRFYPKWYQSLMAPMEKWTPKIPVVKHMSEATLFVAKKS
jgi:ubiquinone/menaquinone biosynthesis C-methylase UbiE